MLTKEQLYYLLKVYPEEVTKEEAKETYDELIKIDEDFDESYLQAVTNIINKFLVKQNERH